MKTIHTILQRRNRAGAAALLAFTFAIAGWHCQSSAQEITQMRETASAGQVVWQHVGRVYLNPNTGKFVYAGYLADIHGINNSLFSGVPGESTAFFTFSTDVGSMTPLANDGDIAPNFVSAGTFSVYYNPSPNGDWSNPRTFSSGQLIATFVRKESLLLQLGPIGFHDISERLVSSESFTFAGQTSNFNCIAPHGITIAEVASNTPLNGTAEYPVAIAVAGTTTAIGAPPE